MPELRTPVSGVKSASLKLWPGLAQAALA